MINAYLKQTQFIYYIHCLYLCFCLITVIIQYVKYHLLFIMIIYIS